MNNILIKVIISLPLAVSMLLRATCLQISYLLNDVDTIIYHQIIALSYYYILYL